MDCWWTRGKPIQLLSKIKHVINHRLPLFSLITGDNSYKTAVLGPQRGAFNSARQQTTNDYDSEAGQRTTATGTSNGGGYLTEKDQNSLQTEYKCTSSASSMTNGFNNNHNHQHRYNRDYPSGARNFSSSYKTPRYHHHQQSSSHSIHSNYSATQHHKNSGASSTTSSTTSSSYQNYGENGWRPPHFNHSRPQYNNYYGYNNKENSGYASSTQVSGNGE